MCCLLIVAALFGARALGFLWWLLDPVRWGTTFPEPLGLIPAGSRSRGPRSAYVFTFPGGVEGLDWALIALGLFADFGSTGGGMFGRDRGRKWRER